ncbi:MAG: serine--tRNA ligase [Conexivisphaerales archaeon]
MIGFVKGHLDAYRQMLKKRGSDFPIDRFVELDGKRRELVKQINALRHDKNNLEMKAAELAKRSEKFKGIDQLNLLNQKIKDIENELNGIDTELGKIELSMPNLVDDSVPEGPDESYNVEIRKWGDNAKLGPDHIEISQNLNLFDTENAAKTSGSRFYYLKGDLVRLNYALIMYGLDFGMSRGFTPLQPPYMLRKEIMESAVDLPAFEEAIYKVENEDLYLITTSEHAILGYHYNDILNESQLPLRYLGISSCFRKEAGAHGRDTKGIFRVHQFEKVEQFIYCKPDDSWKYHEELIKNAEDFFRSLGLPYRVVNVCAGELGASAAKKYDLEVWLPGQGKYREAVSCSNCLDWQAERAKIRYKVGKESVFLHTLNSTLVATERALIAIMENYLTDKWKVEIPRALRPYMNGQEYIELPKKH